MADDYLTTGLEADISVIRKSINIGRKVLDQILHGVHSGTGEIRDVLKEECDFIMECKVCRNLFRSLPNIVAHKRVYCRQSYINMVAEKDITTLPMNVETVVVHPEPVVESAAVTTSATQKKTKKTSERKVESEVAKKVVNQTFEGTSSEYRLFTKVAKKIEMSKEKEQLTGMKLTPISSNRNAVVVTYSADDLSTTNETVDVVVNKSLREASLASPEKGKMAAKGIVTKRKSTIGEICRSLAAVQTKNNNPRKRMSTVTSPATTSKRRRKSSPQRSIDSSMITSKPLTEVITSPSVMLEKNDLADDGDILNEIEPMPIENLKELCDMDKLKCKKCNKKFDTSTKLKLHVRQRLYECSSCKKKFIKFTPLIDHLRKVHKKSEATIKKIYESDRKKKTTCFNGTFLRCNICRREFWRRSSFISHYKSCSSKSGNDSNRDVRVKEVKNVDISGRTLDKIVAAPSAKKAIMQNLSDITDPQTSPAKSQTFIRREKMQLTEVIQGKESCEEVANLSDMESSPSYSCSSFKTKKSLSQKENTSPSEIFCKIRLFGRHSFSGDREMSLDQLKEKLKAMHLSLAASGNKEQQGDLSKDKGRSKNKDELQRSDVKLSQITLNKKNLVEKKSSNLENQSKYQRPVLRKDYETMEKSSKQARRVDVSPNESSKTNMENTERLQKDAANKDEILATSPSSAAASGSRPCRTLRKQDVRRSVSCQPPVVSPGPSSGKSTRNSCERYNSKYKTGSPTFFFRKSVRRAHGILKSKSNDGNDHCAKDVKTDGPQKHLQKSYQGQFIKYLKDKPRRFSVPMSPSRSVTSPSSFRMNKELKQLENSEGFDAARHYPSTSSIIESTLQSSPPDKKAERELAKLRNSEGFVVTPLCRDK